MNIWKPVNKRSKKQSSYQNESNSTEGGGTALPDVIAGISYSETNQEINASTEGAMIGYSSYYSEIQETRGRRREPRSSHTITPKGLGASPSSGFIPPQELGVVPAPPQGGNIRRADQSQSWQTSGSYADSNWNQTFHVSSMPSGESATVNDGCSYLAPTNYLGWHGENAHGARMRSMSSEPHGSSNSRNGDRRVRCSSATRNRQPRSRPNNSENTSSTSPPCLSRSFPVNNFSAPSTSPPVQVIEYQQSPSAGAIVENTRQTNVLRNGTNPEYCREERETLADNTNQNDSSALGESYGYQVPDLEALLTQASPATPANLPMVLASPTRLHNMRRSQENSNNTQLPVRPILPLGIIVNAVFKTRDWLFVRTAHGAEGYVPYRVCLPLGILPPRRAPPDVENDVSSPWELRVSEDSVNPTNIRIPVIKPQQRVFNSNTSNINENGNNVNTTTLTSHHRGRQRGRRRATAESTNQTDLQKLQPNSSGPHAETHGPRESLDSLSNNASHV